MIFLVEENEYYYILVNKHLFNFLKPKITN